VGPWLSVALLLVTGVLAVRGQQLANPREILAGEHFRASRYSDAEAIFHSERLAAGQRGDTKAYLRLTTNLASCRYAQFDYRGALQLFEEVRNQAIRAGESEIAGVALINLSSVYSSQWEPDASDARIQEAARILGRSSRFYPMLKAQQSAMEARRMNRQAAFDAAREAAFAAADRGDLSLVAQVWTRAGLLSLALGRLGESEVYLTEALRLRILHKLPLLESSYRSLARLRLIQRRPAEARNLISAAERARHAAPSRGAQWAWEADKAAVLAANGQFGLARKSYAISLAQARIWRSGVLPAQSSVLASEVSAAQVAEEYALFLAASAGPALNAPSARESFLVLETARAEAFRSELIYSAWRQNFLGADYARALSRLRQAESALLLTQAPDAYLLARRCRAQVAAIESRLGVGRRLVDDRDGAFRHLPPVPRGEAWISFKLGPERSWLWIATSAGVRTLSLPPSGVIARESGALRRAIAQGGRWMEPASALYRTLFSGLTPAEASKPNWLLSLDGPLYEVPFAALIQPSPSGRRPMAFDHTFTVAPSLLSPRSGDRTASASRRFVGVGDAVYNRSDARLAASSSRPPGIFPWFTVSAASGPDYGEWDLPRLPGSAVEIHSAADVLAPAGVQCSLLLGSRASLASVQRELANPPSILHFAAHVLAAPDSPYSIALSRASYALATRIVRPGEVFVALGRDASGRQQLLPASTVASRMRADGCLVVLSGCGSAQGAALPGSGLQGMTRAWLAARAGAVVGSLWSQPDSSGPFFRYLYSSLVQGTELRSALQAAQTAMLRNSDWRNQPRHWAGWILVGKDR